MISQVFATKGQMTQAWTTAGKRVAVTRVSVVNNVVIAQKPTLKTDKESTQRYEIGFGIKKLKNMDKPLRSKLEKSGFSLGVAGIREIVAEAGTEVTPGSKIAVDQVFQIGDVVTVQGTTKGRGFAGAMKRHGFQGGPKTHGQSDRWRAVGSIGQRTTPGRVFKGKRMPGHYGVETQSVSGLVVLYMDADTQELWLSGPVPGHFNSIVNVVKTGEKKAIELDQKASGIKPVEVKTEAVGTEAPAADAAVAANAPVAEDTAKEEAVAEVKSEEVKQ